MKERDLLNETTRYIIVVVLGYVLDIAISLLASVYLKLPLSFAAVIGYIVAFFVTYYFHALWTFKSPRPIWTIQKLLSYGGAGIATIGTRTILLAPFLGVETNTVQEFVLLFGAAGASAVVNYLFIKFTVFQDAEQSEQTPLMMSLLAVIAGTAVLFTLFQRNLIFKWPAVFSADQSYEIIGKLTDFNNIQISQILNNTICTLVSFAISALAVWMWRLLFPKR